MSESEETIASTFVADTQQWLDDELADVDIPPMRAVVQRARALGEISESLNAAHQLDEASEADIDAALQFGSFDEFVSDARELLDEHSETSESAAEPAPPRTRTWTTALLLAAAAVILIPLLAFAGQLGYRMLRAPESSYSSASDLSRPDDREERSTLKAPASSDSATARHDGATKPPQRVEPEAPSEADAASGSETGDAPRPRKRDPRLSKTERLRELDTRARAAWKAGDARKARKLFDRLVASGGRSRIADLAYGDLFALARQLDDQPGLRRYWRRYAKRFPSGQYIDDARAGLCRVAAPAEQRACWQRYLADRPRGTYRRHAQDVLAKPE